jgi:hypothetical protein
MITQPWGLFLALLDGKHPLARLAVARRDGKVAGGVVVLMGRQDWEYSWSAYDPEYAGLGLNTLLVDWVIREAIQAEAKRFGFGSTPPGDRDLLYFKSRWGCEHRPIRYYYWNTRHSPADLQHSYGLARAILRRMPVAVLERLPALVVPFLA